AAAYLGLAFAIKAGAGGARIIQILLSSLALLRSGWSLMSEGLGATSVIGIAINVLILVILFQRDTAAYFGAARPARPARAPRAARRGRRR
ncbi:MAG: hypothetical protein O2894_09760, partial [Planctomycetota bacterium]|nr:hypothetical protein [Planctomycetota bacterium]